MALNADDLTKVIEDLGRVHGKQSLILAEALDKLAIERESCGALDQAEHCFEHSLKIRRFLLGNTHLGVVKSLNHLGKLYRRQGLYDNAEDYFNEAFEIRRERLGPDHGKTLRSSINLAAIYERKGLYDKAENLYKDALIRTQRKFGINDPGTVDCLRFLGDLYAKQGLGEKAESHYNEALRIKQKAFGSNHPRTIRHLNNLAMFYAKEGRYKEAEAHCKSALLIRRTVLRSEHPDIIKSLNRLSDLYVERGLYKEAEPLCYEALVIDERNRGPGSPEIIGSLNRLAGVYSKQGLYSKARKYYEKVFVLCQSCKKPNPPAFVECLDNLAGICEAQGDVNRAEDLYLKALAISKQSLATKSHACAKVLNSLALLCVKQGLYETAEAYLLEALDITRQAFGSRHFNNATILNNLGSLYSRKALPKKAKRLYLKSLAITCRALGANHQEVAPILNNLALLCHRQGQHEIAEKLYKQSLRITEDAMGKDHRETVIGLNNLAHLYYKQALHSEAESLFQEGLKVQIVLLQREAPFLSKSERVPFLRSFGMGNEAFYTYATTSLETARLALFARLNCQGLLERIERRQARLAAAYRGVQLEVEQELRALVQKLASKALLSDQRIALRSRQEELERQLYALLPELKPRVVDLEEVVSALPANSALVEFQRYQPFDGRHSHDRYWGESRYLALILKPDCSVTAVDIGPAEGIETDIEAARIETIQCFAYLSSPWVSISDRILAPLLPHLDGTRLWFVSLDGELHRIPMHVLPHPNQPDQLLAETVTLRLVSSGRDLLSEALTSESSPSAGTALVVADPSFDLKPGTCSPRDSDSSNHQLRSRDNAMLHAWEPLPGTAEEGREVAKLLAAQLLTGCDATTVAVQKAQRPRFLHIATHGFFLPDQPEQQQVQPWLSLDRQDLMASFSGEDPMLRSGLVFAGANQPAADPDEDDGYLTAMEAVHLDLRGTELVTLSACDSGSGDIRTGEGVYGLQRAFIVAGARSLLISLWPVPDEATCAFMVRFYTSLKEGLGRYEALVAVQQEFRQHEYIVWRHPYYWGAWQLIGDGSPIEGL